MSYRIFQVVLILCGLVLFCQSSSVSGLEGDTEAKRGLKIKDMPVEIRKVIDKAAPDVEWTSAKLIKEIQDVAGKQVETKQIVIYGTDKKGREVEVWLESGLKVSATSVTFSTKDAKDLPRPVFEAMIQRAYLGKWVQATAKGKTTETPHEYVFLYSSGGMMAISADGKNVETFNLE